MGVRGVRRGRQSLHVSRENLRKRQRDDGVKQRVQFQLFDGLLLGRFSKLHLVELNLLLAAKSLDVCLCKLKGFSTVCTHVLQPRHRNDTISKIPTLQTV